MNPQNINDHELKMRVIALRHNTRKQLNNYSAQVGAPSYASEEEVTAWVEQFYPNYRVLVLELRRRKIDLSIASLEDDPNLQETDSA